MTDCPTPRRIAIVHEWLTQWGGSEDCVQGMLRDYPGADLFATIDCLSDADRQRLGAQRVSTTFLQRAPWIKTHFSHYLPLTANAVESHDLSGYELIVSSSHAFAKGVLTAAHQLHISYTYTPMRYAWDMNQEYLRDYGLDCGVKGYLARQMFQRLRLWDRAAAHNVDLFVAISHHVRRRIWRTYRRPAQVIYPPVSIERFDPTQPREDFYLTVSRLVSYKRVDLMLEAFRTMPSRKLIVIGGGPDLERLQKMAPPNVTLMGWQPDRVVADHMARARAFVFAAHEDFGISPVEAQAAGAPVIALGVGGALETVCPPGGGRAPTGLFFEQQTPQALADAVQAFEAQRDLFSAAQCRAWSERFSEARFRREFSELLEAAWHHWSRGEMVLEPLLISPPVHA